ncbi:MAG: M3 family metallopeptidase [Bdellovibrionales bacterium]|nr:M3 family metallopeptidase [Bdellovibrionales bacterium]
MKLFLLLCGAAFMTFSLAQAQNPQSANPLLAEWTGAHGGVPPFDQVKVSDIKPAVIAAMEMSRKEYKAIAENPAPPTFDNTLAEMERGGKAFRNVMTIYGVWSSAMNTPEFQKVEQELSPLLAAFGDEIVQNEKLFARIKAISDSPEKAKLTPEQQRLVWEQYNQFVQRGALLNKKQKAQVAKINQRLATLDTQFSQNVLADEEKESLVIKDRKDLEGLPQWLIDAASSEADRRKQKGQWVISNTRSSMEPFLTFSSQRALREKAFKIWTSRGENKNKYNNSKVISEILALRLERSKLFGYPTYAHWHLADTMAKDPQKAMDLMLKVWKPAVEKVKQDVVEMQKLVDAEKGNFKVQPWDYRFYAEKTRKAKYDLDMDILKPYLQLENIRKAMFWSAEKLYGLKFDKLEGIPVYHPSVTVYKVSRDGQEVGLWYFDPYARPGKRSGAWMNAFREQSKLDNKPVTTLVSNNSNFIEGNPGDPVLISWDDATTMFHEFGHALHGLNSNVVYPSLSGTNTARDFVEFPSQFHEHYLETPEVLKFLTNKEGKPIPKDLIAKIEKAKNANEGFRSVEFLSSAIVDMKFHLSTEKKIDPVKFEKETLKELGMPSEIVMRHRTHHFGHIFSGEGYAAGYYGYLWAEVLNQDAFEAFTQAGSPYDKKTAKKFREKLLAVGNSIDPAEAYRNFRGRDPKPDALLKSRGFATDAAVGRTSGAGAH